MTFPLDPGARAYKAEHPDDVAVADELMQPLPPECFQAEADEHAAVTPPPQDAGTRPSS